MTRQRWYGSVIHLVLAYGSYCYAVAHIRSALGLLILGWLWLAGFLLVVDTLDFLFGRWLRRGVRAAPLPPPRYRHRLVLDLLEEETGEPPRGCHYSQLPLTEQLERRVN
jgi:hypothetical protein